MEILLFITMKLILMCTVSEAEVAQRRKSAIVVLPHSRGANLQIQCAVSAEMGIVHHRFERDSIGMDVNAAFVRRHL